MLSFINTGRRRRRVKRVTFVVTYDGDLAHPIHRELMVGHDVSRMELLQWGPTDSVTTLSWFDGAPAAVEELLDSVESAATTRLVPAADGTYAYVHQSEYELGAPVLETVEEAAVVFRPPVVFEASGETRFVAVGESERLGEFYDRLADVLDARIERVQSFGRWPAAGTLTDRQRAALDAAVAVGYYDVPRSGSLADVADELDCARSTAGELVRRAEAAVVTGFVRGRNASA
jgi:predicted DNA binding protein